MREDIEFRNFVFSEDNYLCYPHEISFYCALSMRDKERFDWVFDRFKALTEKLRKTTPEGVPFERYLEQFTEPNPKTSESELFDIQAQVLSSSQIKSDREQLLEGARVQKTITAQIRPVAG